MFIRGLWIDSKTIGSVNSFWTKTKRWFWRVWYNIFARKLIHMIFFHELWVL